MWIALGIIAFLAALITVILLLPVKVLIWNDDENELNLRYRLLFKTYGEDPNPNDPIVKALKKASGISRFEKARLEKNVQSEGLQKTVTESYDILIDLLKELVDLLKLGTVTKLHVKIRCTSEDPDRAAVYYGHACSATYSLLSALDTFTRIRRRGCKIDITCDFLEEKPLFRYDTVIAFRFSRVVAALWRVTMAEAKRIAKENQAK